MKLISVHVPKSGGTSIGKSLSDSFGKAFLRDYSEDPANPLSNRIIDPHGYFSKKRAIPHGIRCVHGHFHPGCYDLKDAVLFTTLRHPVENILSIYFFWKTLSTQNAHLHDYFMENNMTVHEMARLPILRYLYTKTYFGQFDMNRFDLIGRHEDRNSVMKRLGMIMGMWFDPSIHENITPRSQERQNLAEDPRVIKELCYILADDIRFYERYAS